MYFYKYQKPEKFEFNMLRRGEIYFASAADLNDAHECRTRFVLKGTEDLWKRLAQLIFEGVCFDSGYYANATKEESRQLLRLSRSAGRLLKKEVRNQDLGIEKLGTLFEDVLKPVIEQQFSSLQSQLILKMSRLFIERELPRILEEPRYIASFSKTAKNPTMWGHYAGAEKGFVVVYATVDGNIKVHSPINILNGTRPLGDDRTEIGIYNEESLELRPVKYGRKPPKVNAFQRLILKYPYSSEELHYDVPFQLPDDAPQKEEGKIGLVKYSDWRYEHEVRAFYPTFEELAHPVRVLSVSLDNIKGLIFGPRMTTDNKKSAIICCHLMRESLARQRPNGDDPLPEFYFFEANQALDRFDFDIKPFGILDRSYFGKDYLPVKRLQEIDQTTGGNLRRMAEEIAKGN